MTAIPDHPAIITRRRHTDMRQRETFEPVYVPTYRPRPHTVLARYWRAVGPSLIGLGLFILVAGTAAGWIAVVTS